MDFWSPRTRSVRGHETESFDGTKIFSKIFVSFDFCEIENAIAFSISSILRPHKQSLQTFHVCAFENLRF